MSDVVDTMFGWLLEIFGWVFKMIAKIAVWLVKLLFSGIKALFGLIFKKNNTEPVQNNPDAEPQRADNPSNEQEDAPTMRSYQDLASDITAYSINSSETEAITNSLGQTLLTILIHNTLSIHEKGELIEKLHEKVKEIMPNPIDSGRFYMQNIEVAYKLLNQMTGDFFKNDLETLYAAIDSSQPDVELQPLEHYLTDIMSATAALYAPDGKFTYTPDLLEGVKMPSWSE